MFLTNEQALVILRLAGGIGVLVIVIYSNITGKLSPEAAISLIGASLGVVRIGEAVLMHKQGLD